MSVTSVETSSEGSEEAMIGTRLRRLRLARGLTQAQLAAPRYTHAYVSSIEAGRRRASPDAIRHFASRLGVDTEELETGREAGATARLELRLDEALIALSAGRLGQAAAGWRPVARVTMRLRLRG